MILYNNGRANRVRMFMSHPQCWISGKHHNPKFVSRKIAIIYNRNCLKIPFNSIKIFENRLKNEITIQF